MVMRRIFRTGLLVLLGVLMALPVLAGQVSVFAPEGMVKDVRQATARFSDPMVALGDPRLPEPFNIECTAQTPVKGKGRWADSTNWVYDFDDDLPAGAACTFTLKDGLKTLAGDAVTGTRSFAFNTGGPSVRRTLPYEGNDNIDANQIFILGLDAPATTASITGHAYCAVNGVGEKIPLEIIAGDLRKTILNQQRKNTYAYYRILWKDGAQTIAGVPDETLEAMLKTAEERVVVVRCRRSLPPEAKVSLFWGKGIETESGIATTSDQSLTYQVRPAFQASMSCRRTNPRAGCLPIKPVTVSFSAPVARELASQVSLQDPDGMAHKPVLDAGQPFVQSVEFNGPFPPSATLTLTMPDDLKDDAGRSLVNADRFPLDVPTGALPPLAKFPGTFGILEASEGGVLPLTLRNLEPSLAGQRATRPVSTNALRLLDDDRAILGWLKRVQEAQKPRGAWEPDPKTGNNRWVEKTGSTSVFSATDQTQSFTIDDSEAKNELEVIGLPLKDPGFYVVEVASPALGAALLGDNQTRYVATSALVTNMAVHFKASQTGSVIWVTTLEGAKPVPEAVVAIVNYCTGDLVWSGKTDENGMARPDALPFEPNTYDSCQWGDPPVMISARTDDDLSFVLSTWNDGIAPYDFGIQSWSAVGPVIAHTVFDRPLFRAGETVSMKHFLRSHAMDGMASAVSKAGALKVTLTHQGSWETKEFQVDFTADGIGEQTWDIPKDAKLGNYEVDIALSENNSLISGSFQVQEFRVPTMRAVVQGPAAPQVNPKDVQLDLFVAYQSGGGASDAPVKLRTVVEPRRVSFKDYSDYTFGGDPVKTGTLSDTEGPAGRIRDGAADTTVLPLTLDKQGSARTSVPVQMPAGKPASLVAELEYADANGEVLTKAARVPLWPSAINVGIRADGWIQDQDNLNFRVLVVDLKGKPVAGQDVAVTLYQRQSYSYRKRLIGGFYDYESTTTVTRLDGRCAGKTDRQGFVFCDLAPGVSGEVLIRAGATDDQGNPAGATKSIWLAGEDDWWFGGTAADRMDVLPEENAYEPGDTARFQVRMPFRQATALVTVEREGVMEAFVTDLSGTNPVVEVPIKENYGPNVYVSVLAVRGRTGPLANMLADWARIIGDKSWQPLADGGTPTGLIDLGKPAFRLGMAEVDVGWKGYRLDVAVEPAEKTYKIRETAKVRIKVDPAAGGALPDDAEVAIAAVDAGLLELAPNTSWNLLDAMMGRRSLDVFTATAQMQVVGKRHYGKKAVPDGGGGGRERARELFDTLLLWKGRVTLDRNGEAEVDIPLNDSLTAFRIVAIASAGGQLFGTGKATINTTQDLIVHSGLPPLVREGDTYVATFTLRNTTDAAMDVAVGGERGETALAEQTLSIPPGESREAVWTVKAPFDVSTLDWTVSAHDKDGDARDSVKVSQQVIPAIPVRTYSATITQVDPSATIPVARPADSMPGRGGLDLTLMSSLSGSLDGVREYMSRYPYTCIEQRVSRAVALRDEALWTQAMNSLSAYRASNGLLRYFNTPALDGNDTLTAYVLAVAHEAGWVLPDADREALIEALTAFVDGRTVVYSDLETADLAIRKLAAIEALSRYNAAQPAMLDSITIAPNLWPTSAMIDWLNILERMAGIKNRADHQKTARNVLRSRLNFQGTTMTFSTERNDALWWLMISGDSNAVRALSTMMDDPSWTPDVPRLVRGALGRQQRGHWNTTVANAWGVLAMEKFGRKFESTPVTGAARATYGPRTETFDWSGTDQTLEGALGWDDAAKDLVVQQDGTGKPWLMVRAKAALPLKEPLSKGFKITRTVTPVEQAKAGEWSKGDVARVRLDLEAQSDMTWVVVDDPVPAGATILGSGLGGQSQLLAQGEERKGWAWPAFEERRFNAFIAYYRFVPKGKWTVEYTVRLNNPGDFALPPTRVEAMYAPEMFGELPNAAVVVKP